MTATPSDVLLGSDRTSLPAPFLDGTGDMHDLSRQTSARSGAGGERFRVPTMNSEMLNGHADARGAGMGDAGAPMYPQQEMFDETLRLQDQLARQAADMQAYIQQEMAKLATVQEVGGPPPPQPAPFGLSLSPTPTGFADGGFLPPPPPVIGGGGGFDIAAYPSLSMSNGGGGGGGFDPVGRVAQPSPAFILPSPALSGYHHPGSARVAGVSVAVSVPASVAPTSDEVQRRILSPVWETQEPPAPAAAPILSPSEPAPPLPPHPASLAASSPRGVPVAVPLPVPVAVPLPDAPAPPLPDKGDIAKALQRALTDPTCAPDAPLLAQRLAVLDRHLLVYTIGRFAPHLEHKEISLTWRGLVDQYHTSQFNPEVANPFAPPYTPPEDEEAGSPVAAGNRSASRAPPMLGPGGVQAPHVMHIPRDLSPPPAHATYPHAVQPSAVAAAPGRHASTLDAPAPDATVAAPHCSPAASTHDDPSAARPPSETAFDCELDESLPPTPRATEPGAAESTVSYDIDAPADYSRMIADMKRFLDDPLTEKGLARMQALKQKADDAIARASPQARDVRTQPPCDPYLYASGL